MNKGYIGQYGDYERAGRRLSLLDARLSFIYAIAEHCPEVFKSLHAEPLEKYLKTGLLSKHGVDRADFWLHCIGCLDSDYYIDGAYKYKGWEDQIQHYGLPSVGGTIEHLKNSPPWHYSESGLRPGEYEQRRKERLPFLIDWLESLQNWAAKYHIYTGWMLHFAFLKIDSFAEGNRGRDALYTYRCHGLTDYFGFDIQPKLVEAGGLYQYAGGEDTIHEPFSFTYSGWRPTLTDENTYRKYVFDVCERQLDEYLKNAHERMQNNQDMQKIPRKNSKEHFPWLAQYQCGRVSKYALAKAAGKNRFAIQNALASTAELIRLNLRSSS